MKLDKELYTKHAKRLEAILNENSTFAPFLARPDFAKVIEVSLNTLAAVEKKLTTVELPAKLSAKNLVKQFNKLGKNEFKLDENFKYGDESDLIDNINYLSTYCKNIYKVNVDEVVEGKKVAAANPTVDLKNKTDIEDIPEGMAAGMGMGFGAGMGPYDNPFIMGKAYAKLKTEMANGSFYSYKSKPRIIIFAKWFAAIAVILTIIAAIIAAVFAFMTKDFHVLNSQGETVTFGGRATTSGVGYIIVALFGIYPLYQIINGVVGKNDNLKFYFNWPWVLMFILLLFVFMFSDLWVTWLLRNTITEEAGSKAYMAFNNWKIMYVVALGLDALCLVPMIIGAVCNPKQDQALIERTLKQYADETMASSGWGPMPSAGADVQKPVEVKKTDTKKKEDKKPSKDDASKPKK